MVGAGEIDRGEHHGGDERHDIGLEQIGGHAGAIADIVAYVIGDGGWVAWVVLGDTGLDLADEIAADIGALGEDAAAETGEDRDQRGAEAERDERVDDFTRGWVEAHEMGEHQEIDGDAEKRQARHEEAGDGTGAEGEAQPGGEALGRCLRRAHIGAHRDVHADIARGTRQHGADGEADGLRDAEQEGEQEEDGDADNGDGGVLAGEIGLGAFLDGGGDFLHARRAGIGGENRFRGYESVDNGERSAGNDEIKNCGHEGTIPIRSVKLAGNRRSRSRRR